MQQCLELLDQDVAGIHFYTLNRSSATRAKEHRSILFPGVVVDHAAEVCGISADGWGSRRPGARSFRTIDKGVQMPANHRMGVYRELDRMRFPVTAGGVTVLLKETQLHREAEATGLASSYFGVGRSAPALVDVD